MSLGLLFTALGSIAAVVGAAAATIQVVQTRRRSDRSNYINDEGSAEILGEIAPVIRNEFALAVAAGFFELLIWLILISQHAGSNWYAWLLISLLMAAWSAFIQLFAGAPVLAYEGEDSGCLGFVISALLVVATFLIDAVVLITVVHMNPLR